MARFSQFTERYYGHIIHVNPDHVRAVRQNPSGDSGTEIEFAADHKIHVKEEVLHTVKALEDAARTYAGITVAKNASGEREEAMPPDGGKDPAAGALAKQRAAKPAAMKVIKAATTGRKGARPSAT